MPWILLTLIATTKHVTPSRTEILYGTGNQSAFRGGAGSRADASFRSRLSIDHPGMMTCPRYACVSNVAQRGHDNPLTCIILALSVPRAKLHEK